MGGRSLCIILDNLLWLFTSQRANCVSLTHPVQTPNCFRDCHEKTWTERGRDFCHLLPLLPRTVVKKMVRLFSSTFASQQGDFEKGHKISSHCDESSVAVQKVTQLCKHLLSGTITAERWRFETNRLFVSAFLALQQEEGWKEAYTFPLTIPLWWVKTLELLFSRLSALQHCLNAGIREKDVRALCPPHHGCDGKVLFATT